MACVYLAKATYDDEAQVAAAVKFLGSSLCHHDVRAKPILIFCIVIDF